MEPSFPKYGTALMNFTYGRVEKLNIEHRPITKHAYSARACWLQNSHNCTCILDFAYDQTFAYE